MTEIFTAKTVDEAKALAAKKFGKNMNEIKFEIIENEKAGFLGIGRKDAKVKAIYEEVKPAEVKKEEEKPVITEMEDVKPVEVKTEEVKPVEVKTEEVKSVETKTEEVKSVETKTEEVKSVETKTAEVKPVDAKTEEVKPVDAKTEEVKLVEVKTEEVKPVEVKKEESKPLPKKDKKPVNKVKEVEKTEEAHDIDDDSEYSLENFTLIEDESLIEPKVKIARDYITSVLNAMDIDATFVIYQNETGAIINIESNNNGTIIGRRGETLDSLQYLCSIIANKGDKDYFRITIDCLGYRGKRKETLEQLAVKVAKSVIRTGRSQPLEPMNPYERRVIHSAISAIEGVSSRSIGEEPYRKIIISSNNPKPRRNSKNTRNADNRNDRGRRNDRRKNNSHNENFERRSIDLSTSFEKDYKKPKPEDNMEGGLYGKIEF